MAGHQDGEKELVPNHHDHTGSGEVVKKLGYQLLISLSASTRRNSIIDITSTTVHHMRKDMLQEIEEFQPLHQIAHHGEAAFPEFQHAGEMYNREEACLDEAVVGAALPFPGQDDGFAPGEDVMGVGTAIRSLQR